MKKLATHALFLGILLRSAWALPPGVEPRADQILLEMSHTLAQLKEFSLHAHATMDDPISGTHVERSADSDLYIRRPDGIRVIRKGDKGNQEAYYDGKHLTLYSPDKGLYAQNEVPSSIEPMLDFAHDKLGMTFPLADILSENPHDVLCKDMQVGFYAGESSVEGVPCDQLAFVQSSGMEWQIWVEQGARKLPRKIVIRHPEEPGCPRFQAILTGWDGDCKLPDHIFDFEPPSWAHKIEFRGGK